MRKTKLFVGVVLATGCLSLFAASKKSPILMTVGGHPVTLSEFEYMYHKNNQQQVAKQPLDKYVDMFTVYKMKVADAEAAGIDTTKAFQKEFSLYRNELARPYLLDTLAEENLAKQIYEHMKYNVKASHIMLALGKNPTEAKAQQAKLDSIRSRILAGESFDSLALKYSIDPSVKSNNGSMGYVSVGRFPYQFEDACFNTPVGQISPVFKTDFGYHIVKTFDRRPDEGKVLVEHILKLYPRNATEEQKKETALKVDSIYKVVKAGGNFEEIAKKESEDPGSARQGGKLPLFGRGEMVPEFENISFALAKDSISKPFATRYGVHIVKKLGSEPLPPYQQVRQRILGMIKNDARASIAFDSRVAELQKRYNLKTNSALVARLKQETEKPGALDSAFVAKYADSDELLFELGGQKYPVSLLADKLKGVAKMQGDIAADYIDRTLQSLESAKTVEYEKKQLEEKNADYRNLVNEYRDGMLLFEISNRNVWEKASTDTAGLRKFFEANRAKYKWNAPKYKGYLIQTTGDSISNIVKAQLKNIGEDSLVRVLRRDHGKYLRIEKVLAAKGENPMVDAKAFAVSDAKINPSQKYKDFFLYGGKIISAPEELADVRGQVISDYQNTLEQAWVEQLRKKYPVKINNKVMKKVK